MAIRLLNRSYMWQIHWWYKYSVLVEGQKVALKKDTRGWGVVEIVVKHEAQPSPTEATLEYPTACPFHALTWVIQSLVKPLGGSYRWSSVPATQCSEEVRQEAKPDVIYRMRTTPGIPLSCILWPTQRASMSRTDKALLVSSLYRVASMLIRVFLEV